MIHAIGNVIGRQKDQKGNVFLVCETACRMKFGSYQHVKAGNQINLGVRDGTTCPECAPLLDQGGMDLSGQASEDHRGISQAYHDMSTEQDGGRGLKIVSGYGEALISTEEGGFEGGDLGSYGQGGDEGTIGGIEDDPYGESEVAFARGQQAAAHGQPVNSCPFKQPGVMQQRWVDGWEATAAMKRLGR
jgi:ribosome modulation factor